MNSTGAPQREETEDHDLLTYGEAGVRVFAEVGKQKEVLAELVAAGADDRDIVRARERLAALEDAQERNQRQPINDANFESFFGYPGSARRNT